MKIDFLSEVAVDSDDFVEDQVGDPGNDEVVDDDQGEKIEDQIDGTEGDEGLEGDNQTGKQSKEQDSAFAKYRRENEDLKSKLDHFNKFMGSVYGAYGVTDLDSFEKRYAEDLAAQEQQELNQVYEQFENAGISKEEFEEMLSKHPKIKQFDAINAKYEELLNKENINSKMREDFEDLKAEFPQFSKIDDLYALPQEVQDKITEKVSKGNTLKEAYILANFDNLNLTAEQKALNKLNGKSHLKTGKSSAEDIDMDVIDPEELKWYRALNDKASDKEIIEHYRKTKKK